jgi:hypothetical protein
MLYLQVGIRIPPCSLQWHTSGARSIYDEHSHHINTRDRLSRLVSMILKDLYSIKPRSTADRCRLAAEYSQRLKAWRSGVPQFLDADNKTQAPLIPLFQRQRNVLNFAYWHTIILAHRPLMLSSFARLNSYGRNRDPGPHATQIAQSVEECLKAAMCIIETFNEMVQLGQMFRSFWVSSPAPCSF